MYPQDPKQFHRSLHAQQGYSERGDTICAGAIPEAPAPSPVQEALRMLDQCIDDLAFTINAIDDRTHSARLPTTSEDVAEVPKAHQSQLVGQIKTMRDRVYALNSHARTILDTLEL
jgi:hypothetical protein